MSLGMKLFNSPRPLSSTNLLAQLGKHLIWCIVPACLPSISVDKFDSHSVAFWARADLLRHATKLI